MNSNGFEFPELPDIHVSPTMLITAEKILKKKIILNPHEDLFEKEPAEEGKAELEKLNNLMPLLIAQVNDGKEPDIERLASEHGLDAQAAKSIWEHLKKVTGR